MPKAAPAAPKARLLPATAEEKAAHQAFDVAMRQLVIDLDQVDKNGDRKLDFNEFSALVREREIGIQNSATLRQRFDILDADGSGTIEMSEFFVYAMRDSLSRNKARLADLLAQWDADKNGTVERDEFRAVLRDQWGANLHTKDVDALFDDLDEEIVDCAAPPVARATGTANAVQAPTAGSQRRSSVAASLDDDEAPRYRILPACMRTIARSPQSLLKHRFDCFDCGGRTHHIACDVTL